MRSLVFFGVAAAAIGLLAQAASAENPATGSTNLKSPAAMSASKGTGLSGSAAFAAIKEHSANGSTTFGYRSPTGSATVTSSQTYASAKGNSSKLLAK